MCPFLEHARREARDVENRACFAYSLKKAGRSSTGSIVDQLQAAFFKLFYLKFILRDYLRGSFYYLNVLNCVSFNDN